MSIGQWVRVHHKHELASMGQKIPPGGSAKDTVWSTVEVHQRCVYAKSHQQHFVYSLYYLGVNLRARLTEFQANMGWYAANGSFIIACMHGDACLRILTCSCKVCWFPKCHPGTTINDNQLPGFPAHVSNKTVTAYWKPWLLSVT